MERRQDTTDDIGKPEKTLSNWKAYMGYYYDT